MKLENTKVLLTGGTGFLGHHVVKALCDRKADVTLLIHPHEKTWRLDTIKSNVNIIKASLTNREETKTVVQDVQPEVIIHFAGRMERRRDVAILDDLYEHHVASTINLILAADPEITKLVINTGTSEEYGEQADPFVETLPIDPVSPYSASKGAATVMATYLSKAIGLPVVTLRPFITYGPGQVHDTLIPFLIKGVLQKKTVELTEGLQSRDFIFVDDLVSCYLAVIEKAESIDSPQVLNVGTGKKTRVCDVIETIAELMNGQKYLKIGARPMRPGEPESMMADIQKAKDFLGWSPKVSLSEGLGKTIAWWLEHEEIWKE
ncbi:MAG: GDP-mannose 4,6-dehydratase [Bacteroidia bacterium]|nr:GDP-mannose 4,6-dehydratase [Bacteroidia bacterium]